MAYIDYATKVRGKKTARIFLFALSTCGWCAKVKALLNKVGVEYDYVDVDLLGSKEHEEIRREFEKYDTDFTFPKTIINDNVIISGFDEDEILEAIE